MTSGSTSFDRVRQMLADAAGPHGRMGIQLYVSLDGEPLLDEAVGEVRPGEAMTGQHALAWLCSAKPVTVLALARLHDEGRLSTDTPVAAVIPEFAEHGKDRVTVEHLLTHTAVFEPDDAPPWRADRATALARICGWRLAAPPGVRASYAAVPSWLLLSEVIQRITGRDYYDVIDEWVLTPLGMSVAFFRGPGTPVPGGPMYRRATADGAVEELRAFPDGERWPGTEIWGSARTLARPYECLVAGGVWEGRRLLSAEAIEHFCAPVRDGLPDEYFQGLDLTWGRGLCADPTWFGAPPEARVAGHDGFVTSLAVGELDRRLVIAYLTNTAVLTEPMLRRLDNLLVEEIYETLWPER